MKKFTIIITAIGTLAAAALGLANAAAAAPGGPGGFGNAQDTINALQAQGYNVQVNGAAVYPLSGCKVTGIEGLRNSNVNSAGAIIDPTQLTTVYVDISCKGG
jgi:hypothetical protein